MSEPARYRVVVASLITGRVRKVLIRDLSFAAAEAYRDGYGPTSSWKTGVRVELEKR